jgi:hypothetical protein
VASAAITKRLAERKGARVLAVDGVNNGDSPEAQLMRTLIDAFAQYERALIRSRIVQALGPVVLRCPQILDLLFFPVLRPTWVSHFSIADVYQMSCKPLKFSILQPAF